jgi:hypothetical protein
LECSSAAQIQPILAQNGPNFAKIGLPAALTGVKNTMANVFNDARWHRLVHAKAGELVFVDIQKLAPVPARSVILWVLCQTSPFTANGVNLF